MMGQARAGIGAAWWTGLVASHESDAKPDGSFLFSEWDATDDPAIIARKVYRNTFNREGPSTVKEITTLDIRPGSGLTAPGDGEEM